MSASDTEPTDVLLEVRTRLDELIDEYRTALHDSLNGLTEAEARLRLVPSKTTLLGLVKHVTFVEGVWFDQAVTGRPYREIGIPSTPDASFTLASSDTIASVQEAHRRRCEASRQTITALTLDATVEGARGPRRVWALRVQVLRELAQHAGHADILREQILAKRERQNPQLPIGVAEPAIPDASARSRRSCYPDTPDRGGLCP